MNWGPSSFSATVLLRFLAKLERSGVVDDLPRDAVHLIDRGVARPAVKVRTQVIEPNPAYDAFIIKLFKTNGFVKSNFIS